MVLAVLGYTIVGPDVLLHRVRFAGGSEISYEDGATRDEAQRLGSYFIEHRVFDTTGKRTQSYTLRHPTHGYVWDVQVNDDAFDDPTVESSFRLIAENVSKVVLSGKPVEVHYVDMFGTAFARRSRPHPETGRAPTRRPELAVRCGTLVT